MPPMDPSDTEAMSLLQPNPSQLIEPGKMKDYSQRKTVFDYAKA